MTGKGRYALDYKLTHAAKIGWSHGSLWERYWVEGALGALEFQTRVFEGSDGVEHRASGVEIHMRAPADGDIGRAPSHHDCSCIGGPCWHDGSSTWGESMYRMFEGATPIEFFAYLESEYKTYEGLGAVPEEDDE